MAIFKFNNIKITGIAGAVPKNIVKPTDFIDVFGEEEVNKFMQMTGVRETRRTLEHQTASDLGYSAAKNLLENKNIDPSEIGALVFGTHSPDYRRPASAFIIQKRLGIDIEAAVFDISLACSSLIYGVQVVASMMNNSDIDKALLILGDTAGKSVYPSDRSSAMLFGECGTALLLEKTKEATPLNALLRSEGNGYRYMIIPGGGYRNLNANHDVTICKDGNPRTLHNSFIQGTSVFTFTVFDVPRLLKDFWKLTNSSVDDYDSFAFHQANLYILKQIAKKVKIPLEKMPLTLGKYGNTSGASPIISLCDAFGSTDNQNINTLFCGFGIGLSWGVFSAEINTSNVFPIIEDDSIFEEGVINSPNELYSGM